MIAAGGSGSRMGDISKLKKQFRILGGKPVWRWSADLAAGCDEIREIILVLPEEDFELANKFNNLNIKLVKGGASRPESVMNGLEACSCDYVMIHDAARPFVTREVILNLIEAVNEETGAVPVSPVADAIKKRDKNNIITHVDRDGLFITQTPQVFYRKKLIEVIKEFGMSAKDEAEAWLDAGLKLELVDSSRLNFKITVQDDWRIAEALVNKNNNKDKMIRTGLGYDVHRLVPERKLILGGVLIENSPLGLLGHSDADLLSHAIADAILGGAGLPDIGNLFPASDEKFKDADSLELLREAYRLVKANNFKVVWIDAVIQAQVPRLNKYLGLMRENFKKIFDDKDIVNIKAKSAETLDDAGAGLAMTCWTAATLESV
ncbi:MAG: 2-C-methyl-D-erythritol 4-phosphate cytidylyltransferase [Synergistaceae bacterium]|nr:2-C-methyl-D-erythritol 4-phosphate cytidylyltransferase [Synergistaceae bacterium]